MDLSNLSRYREGNRLEVKSAQGGLPGSVWETVSAFANTEGGVILLGVKEQGNGMLEAVGLSNASKMLDDFWNAALSKDKLSSRFIDEENARIDMVDEKEIIVIEIPRADRHIRPIFLNKDILGETWRRTHTGDHRCSREEVQSMLRDAEATSEDKRIAKSADMSRIDYETVGRYRRRFEAKRENHVWNELPDNKFLQCIGAAKVDEKGVLRPTYAGLIIFGQDRWITDEFPHYFLDFRQETSGNTRWEDRFTSITGDWSGNVYDFYYRAYNKLQQALKVPFRLEGIERIDDTPAHQALREALVSCVTNANYHERRGIVCVWKEDALVIENPGDFRIPIEDAMKPGESDPRNETMLKIFALVDAGERAGSGISKIFSGWEEAGYGKPSYSVKYEPDRTTLTLPFGKSNALTTEPDSQYDRIKALPEDIYKKLSENEKTAIHIASVSDKVTTKALADKTGISTRTSSTVLKGLTAKGILRWQGKSSRDPHQYYELVSEDFGVTSE